MYNQENGEIQGSKLYIRLKEQPKLISRDYSNTVVLFKRNVPKEK